MNSEKVKDIKKALEYGIENGKALGFDTKVLGIKAVDILTLINELESENERLSDTEIGELIKENEELAKQCEDWCEIILKKRNQIVKLKDRIGELEKRCHFIWALGYDYDGYEKAESLKSLIDELVGIAQGNWGDVCSKGENKQDNLIKDKLTKFAERLKESASQHYVSQNGVRIRDITYSISDGTINKILKEFIK